MKTSKWFRRIRRNGHYLVRRDFGSGNFYEFSTMGMDSRTAREMARHCNVARIQVFEELMPILLLARERIVSMDNGDAFDALQALERAISSASEVQ